MKTVTLSKKLLFAFFLILLPIFLISLATYFRTVDYLKKEILSELGMIAQGYEGQVYQFLEMAKRRVSDFSSDGFIKEGLSKIKQGSADAGPELSAHLIKNKIILDKTIDTIHILSADGKVVASTDSASIGKDLSGEAFFKNGGLAVTESRKDNGVPALIASSPVLNEKGESVGVVANVILLSELDGLLTGAFQKKLGSVSSFEARPGSMRAYLADRRMRNISGSSALPSGALKIDTLPVRGCVEAGKQTSAFYTNHNGMEVAGVAVCMPSMGWTLIVEMNEREALTPSRVILQGAFTGVAVAVILIAGLLIIFMRKVVRPLQAMSSAAKEIAGGNYDVRMSVESSDEIGTLASALSTMAKDIQAGTQALKESEKRLKRTQQIAKIGSWEWSPSTNLVTCSEEAARLFGLAQGASLESFLGKIHDKDRQAATDGLNAALSGDPFSFDLRAATPEGERIIHMQAESEDTGGSLKVSGAVQDITERKKLEESKEHLARIIDLTTDIVATADSGGKVLYMNKGGRKTLGLGDACDDLRIENTHPEWAAKKVFEQGFPSAMRDGVWSAETEFKARDGHIIPTSQVIMAHKDADGEVQFYSTIARDISERKAAEEALLKKTFELDELNNELHALTMKITVLEEKERKRLAELLHESIGQNLVAIRLTLKNCFKGLESIKPELKETLEQVTSFLDESIRISRTMTADLYSAPLRDKGLMNSIEWYIESVLRPQGINVRLMLDEAVELLTEEIHQVIFSIVRESFQNISKYAGATEAEVSCVLSEARMRLTIKDNGKGFSPVEVKAKRDRGFGLILMREWVKSISGELSISSSPGKGTTVSVEFPATGERWNDAHGGDKDTHSG